MALFTLMAKLGIDTSAYQAGLKRSESLAQSAGRAMRSHLAQAFSVAAVGAFAKEMADMAGSIKDAGDQYGMTRKEVQEFMRVAADSGLSFEQMAQSVNKITDARARAAAGETRYAEAFAKLGISMDIVSDSGVRSADIFKSIGSALKANGDSIETQGAAIDILGVKSAKMFQALKGISDLGPMVIIEDKQIDAIDKAAKRVLHLIDNAKKFAAVSYGKLISTQEAGAESLGGGVIGNALSLFSAGPIAAASILRGLVGSGKTSGGASGSWGSPVDDLSKWTGRSAEMTGPGSAPFFQASMSAGAYNSSQDPLAKIGGLYFGADNGMRGVQQQQLEQLRRLSASVARLEQAATN